jgi:hypothetical protein
LKEGIEINFSLAFFRLGGVEVGLRQWFIDVLEAVRSKLEPESTTDIYPFPFGFLN